MDAMLTLNAFCLVATNLTGRELRAVRSCCKHLHQRLAVRVTNVVEPDEELLVPGGMAVPMVLKSILATCPCTSIRASAAQISACPASSLRQVTSLTVVSDYMLSQQAFGRAQVLLDPKCLIALQNLRELRIQQCLARDGLDLLLRLRSLHTLDLSSMLEVNNKLLSLTPRLPSLANISLPAASCHAPRLNQCTAQGILLCVPMLKRLTALHFKSVDLETFGFDAVKSWQPCAAAHPCIIRALIATHLTRLVALTLDGLTEVGAGYGSGDANAAGAAQSQSVSMCGNSPSPAASPSTYLQRHHSGLSRYLSGISNSSHRVSGTGASLCGSSAPASRQGLSFLGLQPPAHGAMYQELKQLVGLTQLKYLCLGLHVAMDYGAAPPRLSMTIGTDSAPQASLKAFAHPVSMRVGLCVDDELVGALVSGLTQLTGLLFRDCWHITNTSLASIASALPALELLDLEGSCRSTCPSDLSVLAPLTRLRMLGLARCGQEAWCPPYTYKAQLEDDVAADYLAAGHMVPEGPRAQATRGGAAARRCSECTLLPVVVSPAQIRLGTAGAEVTEGPAYPFMLDHTEEQEQGFLAAHGQDEVLSGALSYQDINTEDFMMSSAGWSMASCTGSGNSRPLPRVSYDFLLTAQGGNGHRMHSPEGSPVLMAQAEAARHRAMPERSSTPAGSAAKKAQAQLLQQQLLCTSPTARPSLPQRVSRSGATWLRRATAQDLHGGVASSVLSDPTHEESDRPVDSIVASHCQQKSAVSARSPRVSASTVQEELQGSFALLGQASTPHGSNRSTPSSGADGGILLQLSEASNVSLPAPVLDPLPCPSPLTYINTMCPHTCSARHVSFGVELQGSDHTAGAAGPTLSSPAAPPTPKIGNARYRAMAVQGVLGMLGSQHPNLTSLNISAWPTLMEQDWAQLASSPAGQGLQSLQLASYRGLQVADVKAIAGMENLCKLDLSYCQVPEAVVASLPSIPRLAELTLTYASLTWAASKALKEVTAKHHIRVMGYADAHTANASLQDAMKRSSSTAAIRDKAASPFSVRQPRLSCQA